MATTSLTVPQDSVGAERRHRRGWALAGVGAGLAGIASLVASSMSGAVYESEIAGDAVAITDRIGEQIPQILAFHTATMIAALLLLVFAAGLRRRLEEQLPAGSLLPQVASSGLLLVSVASLLGSGLTTEFVFAAADPELVVPETVVFFGHWIGTIPWLWAGAGVAALAVAVAALRHSAGPRWIGWFSLVLGGLTTLFAISPLQYMAGMVGPVWVAVVSIVLLRSKLT
ncbi:MAG TPA: hypothetical protein VFJ14_16760 [Nocardioidaceae bacterium]|nr:hypothetical protein [Nocardioidaceae bacterium]